MALSSFHQQRADRIGQLADQSAANPTFMGSLLAPGAGGGVGGASAGDALGFMSNIYGHNTNANIAYLNALAALQQQGLANTGASDVANIQGGTQRYGFDTNRDIAGIQAQNQLANTRLQNDSARYGFDTQRDIAGIQGQFGLDQQRLANDAARYGADTQFGIAGLQQQGETGRGLMDNLGADYRTGVGAQAQLAASTYAPQLQSDRFGAVLNGIAAPLMQSWFEIQPGSPYQTRDAPTLNLGSGPNYSGALSSVGAGQSAPMSNPAAAAQPAQQSAPRPAAQSPQPAAQPAARAAGPTQVGRPAPSGMMSRAIGGMSPSTQQMMSGFQANLPRGNQPASSPGGPGGSPQQPAPRPAAAPAPAPQRSFTSSPQPSVSHSSQQPSVPGKAGPGGPGGSNQPAAMQPLPQSFGGPQVTQGPVMSQGQIQAQVGRQQGNNAVQAANRTRNNERSMAARGFSSNSPQLAALNQQAGFARNFQDQEAATQIPAQYAQMNAQHRLSSQLGASNVFGQRTQEELARRGQQSQFQQGILGWLSSLMG